MMYEPEELDVTPVDVLDQYLTNATADLIEVAGKAGNIVDAAELWQLIERLRTEVKHALAQCEDHLVVLAHTAISDAGGEITIGETTIEAGWQPGKQSWDGPRLIPVVAARAADEFSVDRETGEVVPPAVLAEKVAQRVAECLGGLAPSTSWRTGPLEAMGVDPDDYRTREGGRRRVDVKRPRPSRTKEVAA